MNGGVTRFARGNRNKAPPPTDAPPAANDTGASIASTPSETAPAVEEASFPMSLEERPNTGGSDGFNLFKYDYGTEEGPNLGNDYYLGGATTTTTGVVEEENVDYASFSLDGGES